MINLLLYAAVVMIWGSSWIMVSFQVGVVPPELSVAYRIAISSALMFLWAIAGRQYHRVPVGNLVLEEFRNHQQQECHPSGSGN